MTRTQHWPALEDRAIFLRTAKASLKVHLEPIVDARSGQLVACEALMRGVKELGFAHPHALLDHAYRIGALVDLEIELACSAIDDIQGIVQPRPRLFLNLDGRSLPEWKRYRDRLLFHLQSADMSPAEVCIEISEAQQVLEGEEFQTALEGLRSVGFRIAIDDFGTGVSGLRMLYQARPNYLKIDRFFIRAMPTDAHKRLLVHAITRLANTLGARVIAEGVENHEELQACRQADCSLVQGFLIKDRDAPFLNLSPKYDLPDSEDPSAALDARFKNILQKVQAFTLGVTLKELFEHYQSGNMGEAIPITDRMGAVIGALLRKDLHPIFGSRYAEALSQNPSFQFPLSELIVSLPTIDIQQPLSSAVDLVADRARHGVLVLDRGQYIGFLSPYDLMNLANTIRMTEARRRNPLTGLNGNDAVSEEIRTMSKRTNVRRLFCYIDISDFKPFNDKFGFEAGDRAILRLAEILTRCCDVTRSFLGHIGGDDFFVAAEGEAIAGLVSMLTQVPEHFASQTAGLMPFKVQNAKSYRGQSRAGNFEEISIIGTTIVGFDYSAGKTAPAPEALARELARLKARAREQGQQILIENVR